jgi:hypothetical protein
LPGYANRDEEIQLSSDIILLMGRLRRGTGNDDWHKGPVQYLLPPLLLSRYARNPAIVAYVNRAVKQDPKRGTVRNATWHRWEGIFEYLACVEYAWIHLQKNDQDEQRVLYHGRALIFFAQATLDLVAVWLRDQLGIEAKGGNCAFHRKRFQEDLSSKSEEFRRLVDKHQEFVKELNEYRTEWIHRIPGRPILTLGEDKPYYSVPIDPSATIFDAATESAKLKRSLERHGRHSYDISEFANRFAEGTRKLVLGALMASLRHPEITDGPEVH